MMGDDPDKRPRSAIVLLSGGLDSATTLAIAQNQGYSCCALTFRYGQRHSAEIRAAKNIAVEQSAFNHVIVELPLGDLATSSLIDPHAPIPHDRSPAELDEDIPSTYVPARNTIFLACALAKAESTESEAIFCGVNAVDYSGYPDCRPEYIEAFQKLAHLATKQGVEGSPVQICAPLQNMHKADIIKKGTDLGVDYSLTLTCYDPDDSGRACGHCDACHLRKKGFQEADIEDPTEYQ